jgi:farnesyl diphosphate synthase
VDELRAALAQTQDAVNQVIDRVIPRPDGPERRLFEAMRYSALGPGKRLRPFLVMSSAGLFEVPQARALRAAAAVELVHCYSLIHDDLPAMDDAELRRGRPTNHRMFDEATAVLAGDTLLTLAFEVLADTATHDDPEVCRALVAALARAAGGEGMCGGQMIDLLAEDMDLDLDGIVRLQRLKTGALFRFSCIAGAILGRAGGAARAALEGYADALGLAFQIADDLLDAEGDEHDVGKSLRRDAAAGKATFVSLLGRDGARERAREIAAQASECLQPFGQEAKLLRMVARFVVERTV